MKLLFLYIEEFRVHRRRQVSFDGSCVFISGGAVVG